MTDEIPVLSSVEDIVEAARQQRGIHGGNIWWRGQPWSGLLGLGHDAVGRFRKVPMPNAAGGRGFCGRL